MNNNTTVYDRIANSIGIKVSDSLCEMENKFYASSLFRPPVINSTKKLREQFCEYFKTKGKEFTARECNSEVFNKFKNTEPPELFSTVAKQTAAEHKSDIEERNLIYDLEYCRDELFAFSVWLTDGRGVLVSNSYSFGVSSAVSVEFMKLLDVLRQEYASIAEYFDLMQTAVVESSVYLCSHSEIRRQQRSNDYTKKYIAEHGDINTALTQEFYSVFDSELLSRGYSYKHGAYIRAHGSMFQGVRFSVDSGFAKISTICRPFWLENIMDVINRIGVDKKEFYDFRRTHIEMIAKLDEKFFESALEDYKNTFLQMYDRISTEAELAEVSPDSTINLHGNDFSRCYCAVYTAIINNNRTYLNEWIQREKEYLKMKYLADAIIARYEHKKDLNNNYCVSNYEDFVGFLQANEKDPRLSVSFCSPDKKDNDDFSIEKYANAKIDGNISLSICAKYTTAINGLEFVRLYSDSAAKMREIYMKNLNMNF